MKPTIAMVAAFLFSAACIEGYPLGNMNCDTLGEFAQAVVQDKTEGGTAESETAMATLMAKGNKTDLTNMLEIIQVLWTWAKHMSPEGAKQSFAADCRAQR